MPEELKESTDGKRVDRRTEHAATGTQQHDRGTDNAVEACGDHGGREQQVERNRFLAHTVRRTADGEDEHQNGNEDELIALELLHQRCDTGVQRARFRDDTQETAQDQHEQTNRQGVGKALDGSRGHIGDRGALDPFHTGQRHHYRDQRQHDQDDQQDGKR